MNSLTAGSALMIICGLPPSVLMIGDNYLSSAQIPLPHLYRHSDTFHPPAGPLLGAISHYLPGTSFGSDFQPQVPCRTEESTQSGLGQPRVDVRRTRHKGGMDVAIRASRAERQDRGLRGEPRILSRLPRNQDWNEQRLVVLSLHFPNSPG